MKRVHVFTASALAALGTHQLAFAQTADPRLREVTFDPTTVITVPVKRGVVTLIELDPDEAITEVASGLGGDCAKAEAVWCIAAQSGGHHLFVKPKSMAAAPNNLAVVTDRRSHQFRFVVLADNDTKPPVYRLVVKARPKRAVAAEHPVLPDLSALLALPPIPAASKPQQIVEERLQAKPKVVNAKYAIAEGKESADIVPTLVFDDGRFTYFRFPGNRDVPAVFHVLGDDSEALVNARMEDDLLVVDRVSRRLMLRAGNAVVGVWNEAFDIDGLPPRGGTTAEGLRRVVRSQATAATTPVEAKESGHE